MQFRESVSLGGVHTLWFWVDSFVSGPFYDTHLRFRLRVYFLGA